LCVNEKAILFYKKALKLCILNFAHEQNYVMVILSAITEIYKRYIKKSVEEDLEKKMVFVGGPRQVGKTTFSLTFLSSPSEKHPAYLN